MAYEDSLTLRERGGAQLSRDTAGPNKVIVQHILDNVKAEGRTSLTAPEGKLVCAAYGISVPEEGLATDAHDAAQIATQTGFPVVLKIVSPEVLHKTEAGGVLVGLKSEAEVERGFATIMNHAKRYNASANLHGVAAYAYSTEIPVAVLGAKYKWARGAGKI